MNVKSNKKQENLLFLSFAAALIATLGSLYFSEVRKFIPCDLCWFQRIFMYPQVIIFGLASIKKDYSISRYSFVLSVIGGLISLYHYGIQKISFLGEHSGSCGLIPCTADYINWFGFITIPFLALIAFTIISITSFIILNRK